MAKRLLIALRLAGTAERQERVETSLASFAAVGLDEESAAEGFPGSGGPGLANLHRSARKTLRNFVAAEQHHEQERHSNQRHQNCPEAGEIPGVFHRMHAEIYRSVVVA